MLNLKSKDNLACILLLTVLPATAAGPQIEGCPVFPEDNIWNHPIDALPKASFSDRMILKMAPSAPLYADFGPGVHRGGITKGIPFRVVPGTQKKLNVDFAYEAESDGGGYPIPPDPPIEGGPQSQGDRHILLIDKDHCKLYELFSANLSPKGKWTAGSGAIFDLRTSKLRPETWTSGDAAGLPIFPGLVRYDEVVAGEILHAIRFTVEKTTDSYVWPARHSAGEQDPGLPPMGLRVRLKADFNIDGFSPDIQVLLRAMKKYGLILADNGPNWDITGTPDDRWNPEHLKELANVHGSDFEIVDTRPLMIKQDSSQSRQLRPAP